MLQAHAGVLRRGGRLGGGIQRRAGRVTRTSGESGPSGNALAVRSGLKMLRICILLLVLLAVALTTCQER